MANNMDEKVNILMVDDRPENLLTLEAVLLSPDYNLISARSGEEALKCVLHQDFAVILLDVQMPGMNGFETAKLIKFRKVSQHVPIIFITAISQAQEHVMKGYDVGAIDYIFKPFQPEVLRAKIDNFVHIYRTHEKLKKQTELLKKQAQELTHANVQLKQTTQDLQKSEALFRVFGDTSIYSIITFDAEGHILTANPALSLMFGYRKQEVNHLTVGCLLPEFATGKEKLQAYLGKISELEARRSDGSLFPVDIQINEANVQEHSVYMCSIRDTSERKQLEWKKKEHVDQLEHLVNIRTSQLLKTNRDLQLSQERFRKIFDASPSLLAIISTRTKKCIDVNESWLSYAAEELKQLEVPITMYSADIKELKQEKEMDIVSLQNPVYNVRIAYLTKSKEKRDGFLSTEIIHIQGEPCILTVITDVTEKLALMKEMARLDQLNLIGEMAAGIAHEIRNPMTTVRGFLQVSKTHPSIAYIDLMVSELDRANSIITEFLALAKNKTTDPRLQDINHIINAIYPLIHAEAVLTSKHITLNLMDCPKCYLDEKEIRQMILNLSLNGLESMERGTLSIHTFCEENEVVVMIQDEGKGIEERYLDKIGTPFFTTKDNGTGLGLAVCYSIAARHQAVIDVKTGKSGTAFYIRFKSSQ